LIKGLLKEREQIHKIYPKEMMFGNVCTIQAINYNFKKNDFSESTAELSFEKWHFGNTFFPAVSSERSCYSTICKEV